MLACWTRQPCHVSSNSLSTSSQPSRSPLVSQCSLWCLALLKFATARSRKLEPRPTLGRISSPSLLPIANYSGSPWVKVPIKRPQWLPQSPRKRYRNQQPHLELKWNIKALTWARHTRAYRWTRRSQMCHRRRACISRTNWFTTSDMQGRRRLTSRGCWWRLKLRRWPVWGPPKPVLTSSQTRKQWRKAWLNNEVFR